MAPINAKKYYQDVDGVKGLAILGVVSAHMPDVDQLPLQAEAMFRMWQYTLGWCVIGFFYTAGYLNQFSRPSCKSSIIVCIFKRAKRLLIPCFCFSILYKIVLLGLKEFEIVKHVDVILPNDLWSFFNFLIIPCSPQFYFLIYLFFVQLFEITLSFKVSQRGVLLIAGLLLLLPIVLIMPHSLISNIHGDRPTLIPFYASAYLFGSLAHSLQNRTGAVTLVLCSILTVGASILTQQHAVALLTVPAWLIILFRYKTARPASILLAPIGRCAGSIYVWHAPITISVINVVMVYI
jgi:fucose 4-O-acetylase-like acetyltransferase